MSTPGSYRGHLVVVVEGGGRVNSHRLFIPGELAVGAQGDVPLEGAPGQRLTVIADEAGNLELVNEGEGTWTSGVRSLPAGGRCVLPTGEAFSAGGVQVSVERPGNPPSNLRRIATHAYFEARVEEECLRASRVRSQFVVLRIRLGSEHEKGQPEDVLGNVLRLLDIVAAWGPDDFEALLLDTTPEGGETVRARLADQLAAGGMTADIQMACFPRDGRGADELIALAAGTSPAGEGWQVDTATAQTTDGPMKTLEHMVARVAPTPLSVIVLGETGAGKEVLAQRLHTQSNRADKPLLKLNVAALPESLLESELFGYERGAFTGAVQAKAGLLESADGGTIFLDEIGELPLSFQVKLLRVLENRETYRIGALRPKPIDVRFICATHRDLEAEIARGAFREDLYFRLNGVTLVIPPLRERLDELEPLAVRFIEQAARQAGRPRPPRLSPEALALMSAYRWPGNLRELRNMMERAVFLTTGDVLRPQDLPQDKMQATFAVRRQSTLITPASVAAGQAEATTGSPGRTGEPPLFPHPNPGRAATSMTPVPLTAPLSGTAAAALNQALRSPLVPQEARAQLQAMERQRVIEALSACAGNQTAAARMLGISRQTLIQKIKDHGLPRPRVARMAAAGGGNDHER